MGGESDLSSCAVLLISEEGGTVGAGSDLSSCQAKV